jgi:hypothetical protein
VYIRDFCESDPVTTIYHRPPRCAVDVPRVAFGSDASARICDACLESLPCGLVVGKSLMSLAIVAENFFRSSNV